jgi:hypothetical protein
MKTTTLTPTFKPGDYVITTTRGRGIIRSVYGSALLIQTMSGLIVGHTSTTRRD